MDTHKGVRGPFPQPETAPDEPWVKLEPLKKVSIVEAWNLIEALRAAGVAVLGSKMRRSNLFSGKLVDIQLKVPEAKVQEARLIVVEQLGIR